MDCSELAQRLGVSGRPSLLTVARVVKANRYKGHDVVLRALPKVVRAVPDVAYVIVGNGDDLGYLHRLASECGVEKNVTFAGHVSHAELPLLYNACDAFIMCSRESSEWDTCPELPLLYNACDAFIMCSREDRTK